MQPGIPAAAAPLGNPAVRQTGAGQPLDSIPLLEQGAAHGRCVEIACISDLRNAGVPAEALRGARSAVRTSRSVKRTDHGLPMEACDTCKLVLGYYGIRDVCGGEH